MADLKPYRELTPASLIGGILVGALLNMGICYAGLQIGFTIVGSTVAAVIGFGILRGILRQGSILEVNIFQTVASCVNTVNAGVIFTVPVLFLLGREEEIDYTALVMATIGGSFLGVVLIIPLRKQIIDFTIPYAATPAAFATAADNPLANATGTGAIIKMTPGQTGVKEIDALKEAFAGKTIDDRSPWIAEPEQFRDLVVRLACGIIACSSDQLDRA